MAKKKLLQLAPEEFHKKPDTEQVRHVSLFWLPPGSRPASADEQMILVSPTKSIRKGAWRAAGYPVLGLSWRSRGHCFLGRRSLPACPDARRAAGGARVVVSSLLPCLPVSCLLASKIHQKLPHKSDVVYPERGRELGFRSKSSWNLLGRVAKQCSDVHFFSFS